MTTNLVHVLFNQPVTVQHVSTRDSRLLKLTEVEASLHVSKNELIIDVVCIGVPPDSGPSMNWWTVVLPSVDGVVHDINLAGIFLLLLCVYRVYM